MKEITLNGAPVPVVFNMGTLMSFEEITDGSFFDNKFTRQKDRIAIVFAAIYSADNDTKVTLEDLMNASDWQESQNAFNTVMDMAGEFFHLPKVVADAEAKETIIEEGEEQQKN